MSRSREEKRGCMGWLVMLVVLPLQWLSMFMILFVITGALLLWRFPGIARENKVDIHDLLLRCIDNHRLDPLYYLQDDSLKDAKAELPSGRFTTTKLGEHRYEHQPEAREGQQPEPPTTSTTPHTQVPPSALRNAREQLEKVYSPDDKAIWDQVRQWGQATFLAWWAVQREDISSSSIPEPKLGTEEEHYYFAWMRLQSDRPNASREFPRLGEMAKQAFPKDQDYQAAMQWAKTLYERLASLKANTLRPEAVDLRVPKDEEVPVTMPPATDWTYWWLLDQYLGLSEDNRKASQQRWYGFFRPDTKDLVLKWGRELEAQRRKANQVLPPTSENLALVCVVERLTGTDPYGIRCRELASSSFTQEGLQYFCAQTALVYGSYPNDHLYFVAASDDRLRLFPIPGDLTTRAGLRIMFFLMLIWGMRSWLYGVLAKRILKLGEDPTFNRYLEKRRIFRSRLSITLVASYILVPLAAWLVTKAVLPRELEVLITPGQLLFETYITVWLGGTFLLCLTQLIAIILIYFKIDPEKTWIDEFISLPLAVWILFHFQNDLISIMAYVVLGLVPELIIRLPRMIRSHTGEIAEEDWDDVLEGEFPSRAQRQAESFSIGRVFSVTWKVLVLLFVILIIYASFNIEKTAEEEKGLESKVATEGRTFRHFSGHSGPVYAIKFSPDFSMVATGSSDRTVWLWKTKPDPTFVATFKGHEGPIRSLAWGPEGKIVYSGSEDKTIGIWGVEEKKQLGTLTGHNGIVHSVAVDAMEGRMASGSADQTVKLWDLKARKALHTFTGHQSPVRSVAFSPNGKTLASADESGAIVFWDVQSKAELGRIKEPTSISSIAYSRDGNHFASAGSNGIIQIWNPKTRDSVATLKGHRKSVHAIAFDRENEKVASASEDHTVRLWEYQTGREITRVNHYQQPVYSVDFFEGNIFPTSGSDNGSVIMWLMMSP